MHGLLHAALEGKEGKDFCHQDPEPSTEGESPKIKRGRGRPKKSAPGSSDSDGGVTKVVRGNRIVEVVVPRGWHSHSFSVVVFRPPDGVWFRLKLL